MNDISNEMKREKKKISDFTRLRSGQTKGMKLAEREQGGIINLPPEFTRETRLDLPDKSYHSDFGDMIF